VVSQHAVFADEKIVLLSTTRRLPQDPFPVVRVEPFSPGIPIFVEITFIEPEETFHLGADEKDGARFIQGRRVCDDGDLFHQGAIPLFGPAKGSLHLVPLEALSLQGFRHGVQSGPQLFQFAVSR